MFYVFATPATGWVGEPTTLRNASSCWKTTHLLPLTFCTRGPQGSWLPDSGRSLPDTFLQWWDQRGEHDVASINIAVWDVLFIDRPRLTLLLCFSDGKSIKIYSRQACDLPPDGICWSVCRGWAARLPTFYAY